MSSRDLVIQSKMDLFAKRTTTFDYAETIIRMAIAAFSSGACISLAADWLSKKITHNDIEYKVGAFESVFDVHSNIINRVSRLHDIYRSSGNLELLYSDFSLIKIPDPLDFQPRYFVNSSDVNILPTMISVINALNQGAGAILSFRTSQLGHAVALYRSNRKNVHFFDSQVGGWKIKRGEELSFLRCWISYYVLSDEEIILYADDIDFIERI